MLVGKFPHHKSQRSNTFVVASQAAMLALAVQPGDIAVRTDLNKTFILASTPATTLSNWVEILAPLDSVASINGLSGAVTLVASDVGAYTTAQVNTLLTGKLNTASNLSDVANLATARTNLGVYSISQTDTLLAGKLSSIADESVTTTKIADNAITTAKIADASITPAKLSSALSSTINRNYFKNAGFSVVQGSASGTVGNSLTLPTASLGYPGEAEWCIAASGGTPAYAFSTTNQTLTLTGAEEVSAIYVLQRLEGRDIINLASRLATVTFSVEISNSLLSSVIWEVFRPTSANDIHGTISTPTQALIASGTFTVNSTLTRYSATFTIPALATRGLEIRLRVGAQTSGTWVIARPKLEEGSSATGFVCGDYTEELLRCLRHFYALNITQDFVWYGELGARGHSPIITFPVEMFSAPITSSTWSNFFNSYVIVGITTTKNSLRTQIGSAASGGAAASLNLTTFLAHIP
jgi:hypothetical protein